MPSPQRWPCCALSLGNIEQNGKVVIDPIIGPKIKWLFELRAKRLILRQIQAAAAD